MEYSVPEVVYSGAAYSAPSGTCGGYIASVLSCEELYMASSVPLTEDDTKGSQRALSFILLLLGLSSQQDLGRHSDPQQQQTPEWLVY